MLPVLYPCKGTDINRFLKYKNVIMYDNKLYYICTGCCRIYDSLDRYKIHQALFNKHMRI